MTAAPSTEQVWGQLSEDLRRFKHLLEAGEVPTIDGQPHGERGLVDVENPL